MNKPVTAFQIQVAKALKMDVSADTENVAAARIRDFVAEAIGDRHAKRPASSKQTAFAAALGIDVRDDTMNVAYAKIEDVLRTLNHAAINQLSLKPGDRVRHRKKFEIDGTVRIHFRDHVVSSISENGRVYFKGMGCQSGWPTDLEKIVVGLEGGTAEALPETNTGRAIVQLAAGKAGSHARATRLHHE